MLDRLDGIVAAVRDYPRQKVAVAAADTPSVLAAVKQARELDIAEPLLFGNRKEMAKASAQVGLNLETVQVVETDTDLEACEQAVRAVHEGRADLLMKGQVHTDDFLRAVLDKETGLRAGVLMSHCFVFEKHGGQGLVIVTDGAMNIAPGLVEKAQIILNAVYFAECLGIHKPRVGVLAATEVVHPGMPSTLDAAALSTMERRGQFPSCTVDGPFALDNALNVSAAIEKGISGDVAGRCDIMLVPNIEAGNMLAKAQKFMAGKEVAGVVVGAAAPIVLTSRADSAESKTYSIATAVLMAGIKRAGRLKIGKIHF